MAFYKYSTYLTQNQHANFDTLRNPGTDAVDAGVYRCEACGHEIGIAKNHTLPPQNHHEHPSGMGSIKWKLLVAAKS